MPSKLNPFAEWLGLNPKIANPHHFQLLGISTKMTDPAEIRKAVDAGVKRNLELLKKVPPGDHDELILLVKQRLMLAQKILLDTNTRQVYLEKLNQQIKAQQSGKSPTLHSPPATGSSVPNATMLVPPSATSAETKATSSQETINPAPKTEIPMVATRPEPNAAPVHPVNILAAASARIATDQPIPMAIPLNANAQPIRSGAVVPASDAQVTNAEEAPIGNVAIQKGGLRRRKRSKSGWIVGTMMLLAAAMGGLLIYLNWDVLLNLAGVNPDVVPAAPGIIPEKSDFPAEGVGSSSIVAVSDAARNSQSGRNSRSLPSLDLDSLPELDIDEVMSDPETAMVTGRDAERQKEFEARNRARLKEMGFDDSLDQASPTAGATEQTTNESATDTDADSPTPGVIVRFDEMQLVSLRGHLERARRSLYRRDKVVALKSIKLANAIIDQVHPDKSVSLSPEHVPLVLLAAESREIYELIDGFWQQVVASCQTIPGGQEIVTGGQTIGFIEADLEKVIVRHAGSNITYEYYFCPPGLAVELAKQGAIADIPTWNKQLAAFYSLNQNNGVDYQKQIDGLLKVSEEAGHDCDGIRHFAKFVFDGIGRPVEKLRMPDQKTLLNGITELRTKNDYDDVVRLSREKAALLAERLLQFDAPSLEQYVVLLEEARQLGIRSGEAAIAADSIVELDGLAIVDRANLMCDAFLEIAKNELTVSQKRTLMEEAIPFLKSRLAESAKPKSRQMLVKYLTDIATASEMTDVTRRIVQLKN